jgi:ABC-type glycerol-3-phosphate transport system substrate-binding protein
MEKKGAYYSLYMNQFKDLSIQEQVDTYSSQIEGKGVKICVTYECLQNYNSSLAKRLTNNDSIDLFIADSISADASEGKPLSFAGDLYQEKALDLSKTYQGLNENSALSTGDATKLYYLPFGGENPRHVRQ